MYEKQSTLSFVLVCSVVHIFASQEFSTSDLQFVALVQKEFCGAGTLCNSEYAESLKESTRFLDDLPISPADFIHPDCCRNCSCDLATCHDIGNCCPDILDRLPSLEEALRPKRVVCNTTSLKGIGEFYTYWIYSRCSDDFDVQIMNKAALETKSKCENLNDYFDLDTRQPVIDSSTQRTYSNRYCALCNFVEASNMIPYKIGLRCYDGANFFKSINIKTLVQDVLATESCDLEFYWPDDFADVFPPKCRPIEVGCNITGNWVRYDPLIETACHTYRATYNYKYNNVFCFLCNEIEYAYQCVDEMGRGTATVSFSAVLDFNRIPEQESSTPTQCSNNQLLDKYKGVCRNISCIFPGVLQDGRCVNLVNNMTAAYMFQLQFTPLSQQDAGELSDVITVIENYVRTLLVSWNVFNATVDSNFFHMSSFVFKERESDDDITQNFNEDDTLSQTTKNEITVPSTTSSISTTSSQINRRKRDVDNETKVEMEITIPPIFEEFPVFPPPNFESPSGLKRAVLYIDFILWQVRWYFKYRVVQPHSSGFVENVLSLHNRNVTLDHSIKNKTFSFSLAVVDYELDDYNFPIDPVRNTILMAYPSFIFLPFSYMLKPIHAVIQKIKPTLTCPLVKIEDSEYNITNNPDGIFVEELNDTFYKPYVEMVDVDPNKVEYLICTEPFLEVTNKYNLPQTTTILDESVTIQGVLSVIFSCISVLCSLMTLTTYTLFKEFRTQPGVNNMYLCIYLICAQSLFTFAAPQEGNVSELVCCILGALTHFFWLMVIFAMNVCCFHMLTVFKGQPENRTNRDSNCFKSLIYNSYCMVSSIFFVVVNIIVSLLDKDDNNIGYGKGLCYISQPLMVGYVFAIPLGVILFANITSFLFVVIKISRASNVRSSSRKNRNLFKIYAKISSLTGLTWILGFLYVFTKIKIIEYFFIIFNGGIGFFIFMSFVCNKRTFEKYKSLMYKGVSTETHSSGKHSSTMTTELNGDVKT